MSAVDVPECPTGCGGELVPEGPGHMICNRCQWCSQCGGLFPPVTYDDHTNATPAEIDALPDVKPEPVEVVDLVAALRASVEAAKARRSAGGRI